MPTMHIPPKPVEPDKDEAQSLEAISAATPPTCCTSLLPLLDTMDMLKGRWTFLVLMALWFGGRQRFNELKAQLGKITQKVLSHELKKLELHNIVCRTQLDTSPVTVYYELTPYGRTLEPVLLAIRDWGIRHRARMMQGD